jgi:CubicO group peptidase (beta-lactamase class C family)
MTVNEFSAGIYCLMPGSRFEYTNGGYEMLAAVIEEASKEPYREFLRKNLFEPAGMRSIGF